jgi:hypothetical protein
MSLLAVEPTQAPNIGTGGDYRGKTREAINL